MHLTLAFWLPGLLASGALASGIQRRDLETAQNCLASIQSAEEAMDAAIMVRERKSPVILEGDNISDLSKGPH